MWTDVCVSLLPSEDTDGDRWNGSTSASTRGLRRLGVRRLCRLGMLTVWTSGLRRVARTVSSSQPTLALLLLACYHDQRRRLSLGEGSRLPI